MVLNKVIYSWTFNGRLEILITVHTGFTVDARALSTARGSLQ